MTYLLCFISCFLIFINVNALDLSSLNLSSKNAVMYNLNDNTLIYDLNKDEKVSIASLTKIMTCLVAIEHIDNMDDTVTITSDMLKGLIEANAYVIGLKENQKVTYKDLLMGTFLPSGADAARALALSIAGSEDKYVELMNDKANELGLTELHFANVVGLDDDNNYGTADGVAKLLMEALKNDKFKTLFMTKEYEFSDNSMKVGSSLVYSAKTYKIDVDYIEGSKTGLTDNAGKCLASVALDSKNNIEYLLVTLGASTSKKNAYHVLDASKIYTYMFDNYSYHNLLDTGDTIVSLPVKYTDTTYDVTTTSDITYFTDNTFTKDDVQINYTGITKISPFTSIGTKIGEATITYKGNEVKTIDVILNTTIPFNIFVVIKNNILLLVVIILLLIWFKLLKVKKRHKKRKR